MDYYPMITDMSPGSTQISDTEHSGKLYISAKSDV